MLEIPEGIALASPPQEPGRQKTVISVGRTVNLANPTAGFQVKVPAKALDQESLRRNDIGVTWLVSPRYAHAQYGRLARRHRRDQ